MKFQVTAIQFWDRSFEALNAEGDQETVKEYSANIIINDEFLIEVSGNDEYSVRAQLADPEQNDFCIKRESQREAERYDIDEIIDQIEADGFENNFYYLEENGELMQ